MTPVQHGANRRILVIDDNRAIHHDFQKIFTANVNDAFLHAEEAALFGTPAKVTARRQFEIDSAFQGQEGLAMVEKAVAEGRPYSMAFVDVRMPPGWDGVETISQIWKVCPDLQVVICTAYSDYTWDDMRAKLGDSDQLVILKKPFDSIEVLQIAGALVEKWRLLQQTRNHLVALEATVNHRTEELRRKTTLLEALVDSSLDGILVVNERRELLVKNRQFVTLLNIPPELVVQKEADHQLKFIVDSTKDSKEFSARVEYLYNHPDEKSREEIEFKDGRVLDRYSAPVRSPDGIHHGRIWMFRDISERKHTEEKLHLQNSALIATANGIVITDRSGHILWVNPAFTRLTGYSAEEAIGKTPAILKSGAHGASFYKNMWDTVLGGNTWHGEVVNRRKDGSLYYEEMTVTPVLDKHGNVQNFVAVKHDVSRRRRNEEELRAREESFRVLADNVPDAVSRLDRNFRFVYGNRALARDIRLEPSTFLGKTGKELGLPLAELWEREMGLIFKTGEPRSFEFEFPQPEGSSYREARLVPEFSATGEVEFVLAVTRNVSEQKLAEKGRQEMEAQLRQAQKLEAVGQLAAGIAHEINTPTQYVGDNARFLKDAFGSLTTLLRSHAELLVAAQQNAVTPDMLEQAKVTLNACDLDYLMEQIPAAITETLEGVERVAKIVGAMKEFSHPGGKEKKPADLNRAIESTVTVARNEWKYVADLTTDLAGDLPLVPCFLGEFNQAILNLIVNASHAIQDVVKAKPGTKGLITIVTRQNGEHVEVRVSDTGTGIALMHRPHIFEPFFTTKDVGKGTGQGLSVIYSSIVKKHGGTARFETEVGKGTTFILSLPINPDKPVAAADKIFTGDEGAASAPVESVGK